MRSDFVVADVTYPNPNVFYELGVRHSCRTGTIIIRDRNGPSIPFDIAHLRHIEYENNPSGLKILAERSTVKSRRITDPFIEGVWLFLIPVFHGLNGWDVAQSLLGDMLVIDLDVAFDGSGQMLG